ncbi:Fe-S biogenesis protein NfuA [Paraphotobacterium marinum]|uniref:Fe/S biogenesis protein NfuA n=1 Tax=Paraphotobacterium marinum TaxID=1755811 RepID=A0A220VCZ8_9GAMM|nr:Fe-S biogenesis protein NfuA [Paraphotobacterium marinum]ASK78217.1 Fe-S biogenesis protein NfuA [Paraphotobacterium marinum]
MSNIKITQAAQDHFVKLLSEQEPETNIRVFVINPGTPSAECGVSYCPKNAIEQSDTEIKLHKFSAFIDELSLPFLEDAEIDFVVEDMNSQLTLKAPNAKMRKLDENAPLLDKVDYIIQTKINPQLSNHGGHVSIVEITKEGVAVLQFGGGCNGCSMVDVTLKEGIEKELLSEFPDELKGVKDITEHSAGEHSYY